MVSLSRCRNHLLVGIPHCCMFGALWSVEQICLYVCKTMVSSLSKPSAGGNPTFTEAAEEHAIEVKDVSNFSSGQVKIKPLPACFQKFKTSYFIQKHSQRCKSLFGNIETRLVWKFCKFSLKLVVRWLSQRLDDGCGDTWQLLSSFFNPELTTRR